MPEDDVDVDGNSLITVRFVFGAVVANVVCNRHNGRTVCIKSLVVIVRFTLADSTISVLQLLWKPKYTVGKERKVV